MAIRGVAKTVHLVIVCGTVVMMMFCAHASAPLFHKVNSFTNKWVRAKAFNNVGDVLDMPLPFAEVHKSGVDQLRGIFKCPLNVGGISVHDDGSQDQRIYYFSYGYNAWGGGTWAFNPHQVGLGGTVNLTDSPNIYQFTATTPSMVQAPSNLKAFGDGFRRSSNPIWDAVFLDDAMIAPAANVTFTSWKMPIKKQPSFLNQRRRANRVFADDHLESEDMRRPFLTSDFELRRWNIDNEPHHDWLPFWEY